MYDLIIVGAGPAGMTAAVYAARKKMNTLLVTLDFGGQVNWTLDVENYMGYQYISGMELMQKFEEQVNKFSIDQQMDQVVSLTKQDDVFIVGTEGGQTYQAHAVVIASGKRSRKLNVPHEERLIGRGVSYCATCDGPLFADKKVAVIGAGNSALQSAVELSRIASDVNLIVRSKFTGDGILVDKVKQASNIHVHMGYETVTVEGEEVVERITVRHTESREEKPIAVHGVFIEIGLIPNTDFIGDITEKNSQGEVVVDCMCRTKVPGLFAAGDVTTVPEKQIIIACGEGAKAALMAHQYLLHRT